MHLYLTFISMDLETLLEKILRFIKGKVIINGAETATKFTKTDNHKNHSSIGIGFSADKIICTLRMKKVKLGLVEHQLSKNPLLYTIMQNIACLYPKNMCNSSKKSKLRNMKVVHHHLSQAGFFQDNSGCHFKPVWSFFYLDFNITRFSVFSREIQCLDYIKTFVKSDLLWSSC